MSYAGVEPGFDSRILGGYVAGASAVIDMLCGGL